MACPFIPTYIMPFLLLVSGEKFSLAIIAAGFLVTVLLFLILKPLSRGIMDVFGYYQSDEIKDRWLNKLLNGLIAILLTLIIFFPPLAFGGEYLWGRVILEFLILLLFFTFILKSIRNGVIKYRKNILNAVFFSFVLILIFQILLKRTLLPYQTFLALKTVSLYFALFVVIIEHVQQREEIDDIILKIMLAGTFISCVGILQVFTGANKIYWTIQPKFPTFFGTFEYWNQFACYVSMVALLTVGSLCVNISKSKELSLELPPKEKLSNILNNITKSRVFLMYLCFSIMAMALLLTKSRAGILCFLASLMLFISSILRRRHLKKVILPLFIGIFIVGITLGLLSLGFIFMGLNVDLGIDEMLKELHTVFSSEEYVFRARLYTIDGPKIFRDYPFFGIGLGSFGDILPLYLSVIPVYGWGMTPGVYRVAVVSRHLFNDILQLLIEIGSIGFVILLIPFSIFIIKSVTKVGKTDSEYKYLLGMGCLSSLLFLGLHTMIDYDMSLIAISSLFTIHLAISLLIINIRTAKDNLEIEMETKEIIILKNEKIKTFSYALSTVIFLCFAFIILRPPIVHNLTKNGAASFSSFNKALAINPGNADLYHKYHKFIIGQYKKDYIAEKEAFNIAEAAIDKAIELNPYKTSYLTAKGDFMLLQRNYEGASRLYEKASLMEPNNPFIQMGYATVMFWQAIREKYMIEKKNMLLRKGLIYYAKARSLSNNRITLSSLIKDEKVRLLLMEGLKKEGIDIL